MQTRGERMLALRKARMAASPAILRGGFRPFFLLGSAWAVLALAIWLGALLHGFKLPSDFDPLAWHRHEMLFGFTGAVIVGFLLTAIPNWTGRLPIAGLPLAALAGLWLAGRMALLLSGSIGLLPAAVLDAGFYLVFAAIAGREVVAAKNRNLPVVGMVLLLGIANVIDYAAAAGFIEDSEAGIRAGIALVVLVVGLIGGRIVPSFTRNWMVKRGWKEDLPTQPGRFDQASLAASAAALLSWVVEPEASITGIALILTGALHLARMARWRGWRTTRDPLVLILHVGYLWLPAGLLLLGWSVLNPAVPRTAAIHALTAGAMGTMILAVMTRATLGHTGRELRAGPATVIAYALIVGGALLRVVSSLGFGDYAVLMEAAGALWGSAFLVFLATYGPMLCKPRVGEGA